MKLGVEFSRTPRQIPEDLDVVILPARNTWGDTFAVVPHPKVRASLSVFGSTRLVQKHPEYRALSREGLPALPGEANPRDGLAWGWVCPRHPTYLETYVLPVIQHVSVPIVLQDFQYPGENFCFCARCQEAYAREGSVEEVRRATLREAFHRIRALREDLWLTLHPAPCSLDRFGIPEDVVADIAAVLVPIYDLTYRLTWWMDDILFTLTRKVSRPLWVELYGVEPPVEGLMRALVAVARYPVEGVVFYVGSVAKLRDLGERLLQDPRLERVGLPHLREMGRRLSGLPG